MNNRLVRDYLWRLLLTLGLVAVIVIIQQRCSP